VVVTMMAFVTSSPMKRTWPSTSEASAGPSGAPGATVGGGGSGGTGSPARRPDWLNGVEIDDVVVCTVSRPP
jgi:hypothetical protein